MAEQKSGGFAVEFVRPFPGARYGLNQKTALVSFTHSGTVEFSHFDQRLAKILSGDALFASISRRWETLPPGDDRRALGNRIRDVAIVLLGWSREPIYEARLLAANAERIVLATAWERERTLRATLGVISELVEAAATGIYPERLRQGLADLQAERSTKYTPVVARLTAAAYRKGHPVEPRGSFLQVGWGARAKRLTNTMSDATSAIAVRAARQKFTTNRILTEAGLPVPKSLPVIAFEEARAAAERIGWPVVVKPAALDGGVAITTNIMNEELLRQAFDAASTAGEGGVIVEQHVHGADHRLLVVGGRMLICTKRTPGGVIGDGHRTVTALVEAANADPRRGTDKQRSMLIRLALDAEGLQCLEEQGLTPDSVPAADTLVKLRRAANISIGGTAEDVTTRVHPDNRQLAIRAARVLGLDIAGVDFLCDDIERSWRDVGGAICEVNAQPMLRVHWLGDPARDIEGEILDVLTDHQTTRIPVVAIAHAGATSAVATTLHRILTYAGRNPGTSGLQGVRVADEIVRDQMVEGLAGVRMVLSDPRTETGIIELPVRSLGEVGSPCDRYDVVAITNTTGQDAIAQNLLAQLVGEALKRAQSAAVIDAADELALKLCKRSGGSNYILVTDDPGSEAFREHLTAGGRGAFSGVHRNERWIMLAKGTEAMAIAPFAKLSAAEVGAPPIRAIDVLFACAIAWDMDLTPKAIREALCGADAIGATASSEQPA